MNALLYRLSRYLFGCFCFGPCDHKYADLPGWAYNAIFWLWSHLGLPYDTDA